MTEISTDHGNLGTSIQTAGLQEVSLLPFQNLIAHNKRVNIILTLAFFIPSISVGFLIDFGRAMGESIDNSLP